MMTLRSVILGIALTATPFLHAQQDAHARLTPAASRKPAPAFNLVGEDGKKLSLADLKGKVVLLNFWATECGGCVLELPRFVELQNTYKSADFTTVGVSMDISYEGLKDDIEAWRRVRPFAAKSGLNYPILMGDDAISKAYSLSAFPATYLIDKSGKVAASYTGVLIDKQTVATNIKGLLAEH